MTTNATFSLDAGSYMIGDPYYFIPRSKWFKLLKDCDYFSGGVGTFEWIGSPIRVVAFATKFGDGCYTGSDGRIYGVDTQLLGIISTADLEFYSGEDNSLALTEVFEHTFSSAFDVFVRDGVFHFGDFIIDTNFQAEFPSV